MPTILCSVSVGDNVNQPNVVAYGFSIQPPLGVCQSFAAFQQYIAVNTPLTVPGADQGGWTDLFAGAGITMGA